MRRSVLLFWSVVTLGVATGQPSVTARQDKPAVRDETARLAAVGRLWTTVRYAHPFLTYKDIDWDAAFVAALPKIRAAGSASEYREAVAGMLAALGDPATTLRPAPARAAAPAAAPAADPRIDTLDGVLVIRLNDYRGLSDYGRTTTALQPHLAQIRGGAAVVFDLRERTPGPAGFALRALFKAIAPTLTAKAVTPPATRSVMHSGYAPQFGTSSGGYYSALQLTMGEAVEPAPGVVAKRVAFVVNRGSVLPDVALALQQSGDGIIVAEGAIDDATVAPSLPVDMGEGVVAVVRTGEIVDGHEVGIRADVTLDASAAGTGDAAMTAATAFVKGGPRPSAAAAASAPPVRPAWRPDRTYAEAPYPSAEHRVLGVYRLWGVVNYFFPYRHLMTRDWDTALARYIPKVLAAKDALEYGLVIAEMATWLEDSHVNVGSTALQPFYGEAIPPLTLRYIENVPVVIGFRDETAARAAGVQIGDVVTHVDGQAIAAVEARYTPYVTASNPWSLKSKLVRYLVSGPEGSKVTMTLQGAGGARQVTLDRKTSYQFSRPTADGPSYRIIEGNVGYVDLTRLEPQEVDPMFDALTSTTAIVFDMRGYPRGVFMSISPRLNVKGARHAATFLRPVVSGGSTGMSFTFQQMIPPTPRPKYTGRTVMLIDERAISQSEHTGLFLEQASGVTFIGSRTAGANGDVTRLMLPGRVSVGFTGHDVRHADGRQLQKVGLEPHIEVHPTIAGLRAGRDELLERALRFVKDGK